VLVKHKKEKDNRSGVDNRDNAMQGAVLGELEHSVNWPTLMNGMKMHGRCRGDKNGCYRLLKCLLAFIFERKIIVIDRQQTRYYG
jgi:hypothetical protein